MAKKRKKRKLKIRNILIFLGCILCVFGIIFYILNMPIKNIYITGNSILSDDVIIRDSKIKDYPSFLLTSSGEIKKRLLSNSYINNVVVKKGLGNAVYINVSEYNPLVVLDNLDQVLLSNGKIVDNLYDITDIPVVNNLDFDSVFDNFVVKFNNIDKNILRQISEVVYSPVNVDKSRFLLYMNDGNLIYITLTKINLLNKYNSIKDKIGDVNGVIYLDSGNYIEIMDTKSKTS